MKYDSSFMIKDLAEVQTGPFGSQLHNKDYVAEGTPIVTVEHLGGKRFSTQNLPCVSDEDKERLSKYSLQKGDIVFSRVGSVDRCSFVSEKETGWLFSGRCLRVRPNSNLCIPEYLYYYLCMPLVKEKMRNIAVGATMPSINTKLLCEIPVSCPDIEIQKRIASILSSLDDKIEVNNQINRNLEEQLLLMYIANCEKTNSSKDSLSKFCSFQEGYVNPPQSRSDFFDGPIKWLRAVDINESYIISTTRTLSEKGFLSAGKSALLFPPDSIAITKSGTIGRLGLIANEMCGNRAVINIVPLNPKWLGYIYCYLKSHQTEFSDLAVGSVQKNLYVSVLAQLEIESPEEKVWTSFHCFSNNILRKIKNNCLESFHLSQLRDILLPKLMSGEMNLS